jgi:hypothetical protein
MPISCKLYILMYGNHTEGIAHRHCEQSEAIQKNNTGSPRYARDDGIRNASQEL